MSDYPPPPPDKGSHAPNLVGTVNMSRSATLWAFLITVSDYGFILNL